MVQNLTVVVLLIATIGLAIALVVSRRTRQQSNAGQVERNKQASRRFFEALWAKGDLSVIDEVLASGYARREAFGAIEGVEAFRQFASRYRQAFPDMYLRVEDQVAAGDYVVDRWVGGGTHLGDFQGVSPTGRRIEVSGIAINRFSNGRLMETWTSYDALGMLVQLGVVELPPGLSEPH